MLKVLIADDEEIERRYLAGLFQKHEEKFQVAGEAKNGKEVVELALETKPDIIIMDISMPLLGGLESAYQIKSRFPDTMILLNTAYAEFEFAKKAVDYDLDAYLLKPAKESEILQAIDTCLKRKKQGNESGSGQKKEWSGEAYDTPRQSILEVVQYIDDNFQKPLTLNDLADTAHFSPTYLSRLFHQEKGMTIKTYINKKRLENAKFLLDHSELSISCVAVRCGYSNVSHFNRLFKQHQGCSPLEYRRGIWRKDH